MQNATGQGDEKRGASVQTDPDVVVACDRCPRELKRVFVDGVARAPDEYRARWSEVAVQTGMAPAKLLTLCAECTRSLRLFMVGARVDGCEETWNRILTSEVRS